MSEVDRLRKALVGVEKAARDQPWAKERPWRAKTHVGEEQGVVVVDLHDLKAGNARKAVDAVVAQGPPRAGGLVFVVGQGRHSVGRGVLGNVVRSALGAHCKGRAKWRVRLVGPARVAWITDPSKAPKALTGGGGVGFTLWLAVFGAAFLFAVARALGWV